MVHVLVNCLHQLGTKSKYKPKWFLKIEAKCTMGFWAEGGVRRCDVACGRVTEWMSIYRLFRVFRVALSDRTDLTKEWDRRRASFAQSEDPSTFPTLSVRSPQLKSNSLHCLPPPLSPPDPLRPPTFLPLLCTREAKRVVHSWSTYLEMHALVVVGGTIQRLRLW